MKYKYSPKPLFYIVLSTIVLAVFIPILIPVVLGFWMLVGLINFSNRISKENRS